MTGKKANAELKELPEDPKEAEKAKEVAKAESEEQERISFISSELDRVREEQEAFQRKIDEERADFEAEKAAFFAEQELELKDKDPVPEANDPETITWIRPSGLKITTKATQEMVDHAKSQGWKPEDY